MCGPCWAEHGGQAGAAEIGPPPPIALGSRDPRCQREWLDRLWAEQWVQLLRVDTRRKLRRLCRKLAAHADWDTFQTWPTWPRLMAASGWARSTLAGWLRQLRVLGWLGHVEHGSTPATRPMGVVDDVEGNRAAVYVLRVPLRLAEMPLTAAERARSAPAGGDHPRDHQQPGQDESGPVPGSRVAQPTDPGTRPVEPAPGQGRCHSAGDETWTPTTPVKDLFLEKDRGSTRARDFFHNPNIDASVGTEVMEALRARLEKEQVWTWDERVPTTRAQMLAAACELRRQHPILARLSGKAVRATARPYWRAGWTNADLLHALAYRPNSWWYATSCPVNQVISPAGWARSRLAAWRTPTGQILPGHSAQQATRDQVAARHGRAGLAALPAGAAALRPEHLLATARALAEQARETYQRNRRRDRVDELARPRSSAAAADPAGQRAGADACHATLAAARQALGQAAAAERDRVRAQLLAQARAHQAATHPTPASAASVGERGAAAGPDTVADSPADRARALAAAAADRAADRASTQAHARALARARADRAAARRPTP